MNTMFWVLWFFIAIVVVVVAFTLRKEDEEMPRRDILRAVESTGGMGVAEKSFLWVFSWLDTRFRVEDYWNMSKNAYYNMHRQMPLSHAEKYKLRIIWYWYPYCLGGISFLSLHYTGNHRNCPRHLLCSRWRRRSFSCLCLNGIYHDKTSIWLYHQSSPSLDNSLHGSKRIPSHVQSILYRCLQEPKRVELANRCRIDGTYNRFRIFRIPLWDSLAYGAAVIGIKSANATPLVGKYVATLLFAGSSITPRTVTRMYFIHVFILPVIVTTLIIVHLFIVWVQGIAELTDILGVLVMGLMENFGRVASTYMDEKDKLLVAGEKRQRERMGHAFWPHEVLRDALIFGAMMAVLPAPRAWIIPPPLHGAADPYAQAGFVFLIVCIVLRIL